MDLMIEFTYFHDTTTIDSVGGNVVDGIFTELLQVIFTKIDGRRETTTLTVILAPNAVFHLFSPAREAW